MLASPFQEHITHEQASTAEFLVFLPSCSQPACPRLSPPPPLHPLCCWQEHIKREKAIMAEFASPFLVNLVASFKDAQGLYMLLELVQGGEFFTYLQVGGWVGGWVGERTAAQGWPAGRRSAPGAGPPLHAGSLAAPQLCLFPLAQGREAPLSEEEARFYAGCVILGLEYMHDRSIAWRCGRQAGRQAATGSMGRAAGCMHDRSQRLHGRRRPRQHMEPPFFCHLPPPLAPPPPPLAPLPSPPLPVPATQPHVPSLHPPLPPLQGPQAREPADRHLWLPQGHRLWVCQEDPGGREVLHPLRDPRVPRPRAGQPERAQPRGRLVSGAGRGGCLADGSSGVKGGGGGERMQWMHE